jgi:predicted dehydrogenase
MFIMNLRFGLLGSGLIVRDYHLQALLKIPGAEVVAAANHRPDSLQAMAAAYNIPKTSTNFEDIASDPDIDAVVIGVANCLNAELTRMMLGSGKHVLCEKPMAVTVRDAESMIDAAERAGRKLMIAHVWRSDAEMNWLREHVMSGRLGKPCRARIHGVAQNWGPEPGTWRTDKKQAGGGPVADVAIHGIDALHFVFGDDIQPQKVFATTANHYHDFSVEDTATIMVEYDNGMTCVSDVGWYSRTINSPHGALEIFGTDGYARMLPAEVYSEVDGEWTVETPDTPRAEHIFSQMYVDQMQNFIDCIVHDTEPVCSGRQALNGIRVMEAAYRSAGEGECVKF